MSARSWTGENIRLVLSLWTCDPRDPREGDYEDDADENGPAARFVRYPQTLVRLSNYLFAMFELQ